MTPWTLKSAQKSMLLDSTRLQVGEMHHIPWRFEQVVLRTLQHLDLEYRVELDNC